MRYLNFTLLIVACVVTASAEEMPLPFSSQQFESQSSATTAPNLLEQFDQINVFGHLANPIDNEIDTDVFSARSLGRFLKQPMDDLAQLGTDFPTDYMQDPELDQVPAQTSPARQQAPELNTDVGDAPPAPSAEEIKQLFGDPASGVAPQSLNATDPVNVRVSQRVADGCTGAAGVPAGVVATEEVESDGIVCFNSCTRE